LGIAAPARAKFSYNGGMRRWFGIAALNLILLTLPAWAQHGGGHASGGGSASHSSGFASHSSGSFHSGNVGHSYGGYLGANSARSFSRSSITRVRAGGHNFGDHDRDRRGFRGRRGYYPYGLYYPYYSWYMDPLYQSDYQNNDDSAVDNAGQYYPAPSREDDGLQRDVQALSGKIDRLQADVEARNRPRKDQEPSTALVFRDKHVEEVRNYAISGGTLWVLNEQAAKKIPLAQLDLEATAKMNDERGVDFQVPK
jgi:hypothetical protein